MNSPKQSTQFWSHYNSTLRMAVQESMLNNLGQCVMICKIRTIEQPTRQPSISKTEQFSESFLYKQKRVSKGTSYKGLNQRRIKIDVI
mmetsp:Transcript_14402/g.22362  ORF Transcript_14402/g.22362 Transcript_14402/m.22362 type:complete len:88 (-) Transcript_14402:193-456(-)